MSNVFRQTQSGRLSCDDLIDKNPVSNEFWEGTAGYTLNAGIGSYEQIGQIVALLKNNVLPSDAGNYVSMGQDIPLTWTRALIPDPGLYIETGQPANLLKSFIVPCLSGSYNLSGGIASLFTSRNLVTESGGYALQGADLSFLRNYLVSAEAGTASVNGQVAGLLADRILNCPAGEFNLPETPANLLLSRLMVSEAGNFILIGQDAILVKSGSGYALICGSGAFSVNGQEQSLLVDRIFEMSDGVFLLSGSDLSLLYQRLLDAMPDGYQLSGQDAILLKIGGGYVLYCDPGILNVSGAFSDLLKEITLVYSAQILDGLTVSAKVYDDFVEKLPIADKYEIEMEIMDENKTLKSRIVSEMNVVTSIMDKHFIVMQIKAPKHGEIFIEKG